MQSNHAANIAGNLPATLCGGEVRLGLLSVELNDKIAPCVVDVRGFLREASAKELWQTLHLNFVDFVEFEPS